MVETIIIISCLGVFFVLVTVYRHKICGRVSGVPGFLVCFKSNTIVALVQLYQQNSIHQRFVLP